MYRASAIEIYALIFDASPTSFTIVLFFEFDLMVIAFYILIALLGMVLASFAGVIIERGRGGFEFSRLPEILGGRSYCPGCNKKE